MPFRCHGPKAVAAQRIPCCDGEIPRLDECPKQRTRVPLPPGHPEIRGADAFGRAKRRRSGAADQVSVHQIDEEEEKKGGEDQQEPGHRLPPGARDLHRRGSPARTAPAGGGEGHPDPGGIRPRPTRLWTDRLRCPISLEALPLPAERGHGTTRCKPCLPSLRCSGL